LSQAGLRPTRINIVTPKPYEYARLRQAPLMNSPIPGPSIPVTPSISDPTILYIITIPGF
jgi:hypothetical protein